MTGGRRTDWRGQSDHGDVHSSRGSTVPSGGVTTPGPAGCWRSQGTASYVMWTSNLCAAPNQATQCWMSTGIKKKFRKKMYCCFGKRRGVHEGAACWPGKGCPERPHFPAESERTQQPSRTPVRGRFPCGGVSGVVRSGRGVQVSFLQGHRLAAELTQGRKRPADVNHRRK